MPVPAAHKLRPPPELLRPGPRQGPARTAAPGTRAPAPGLTPPVTKGASGRSRASLGLLSAFAPGSGPSAVRATRGSADGRRQLIAGCAEEEIASPSFGFSLARVAVADLNAGPDGDGDRPP